MCPCCLLGYAIIFKLESPALADTKALIHILSKLSLAQRLDLAEHYKGQYRVSD